MNISTNLDKCRTIVEMLREHAIVRADKTAFTWLDATGRPVRTCTYGQLDMQARSIAAHLQQKGLEGERILLLYPSGIDYIVGLLGCMYAGSIAVPTYAAASDSQLHRLELLQENAVARLILATEQVWRRLRRSPVLAKMECQSIAAIAAGLSGQWAEKRLSPGQLGFLQYTSGSTGDPKGVMVSHANICANEQKIQAAFQVYPEAIIVGWLPLYHDMGLIGNVLQCIWSGAHAVLMAPMTFLQNPVQWLKAISAHRGTISGGPNFAYDLCVKKIAQDQLESLDLSSWRMAFNGAEPVQIRSMAAFAKKFAHCGFQPGAFFPCYGLAEATLLVSGKKASPEPTTAIRPFDPQCPEEGGRLLVSVGQGEQEITIVNPDTLVRCQESETGEIWIQGPSVCKGYWNYPDSSGCAGFDAYTADQKGPYLRTGDLGFMQSGNLYISGRIKETIIIKGRNYYPADLEEAIRRSHTAFDGAPGAAFSYEDDSGPKLAVMQELNTGFADLAPSELAAAVNQTLAQEFQVEAERCILVRKGGIPRTSSGKVRRLSCKKMFLENRLNDAPLPYFRVDEGRHAPARRSFEKDFGRLERIVDKLIELTTTLLQSSPGQITKSTPLASLGIDSLLLTQFKMAVDEEYGIELPLKLLFESADLEAVAKAVFSLAEKPGTQTRSGLTPSLPSGAFELSYGQQAIWFLHHLAGNQPVYQLHGAATIHGPLDIEVLRKSFELLIVRHESLRTRFLLCDGRPMQTTVLPAMEVPLTVNRAGDWSEDQIQGFLESEAGRPISLFDSPLFRLHLVVRDENCSILLFVIHHIITDFWSIQILMNEWMSAYTALRQGRPPALPAVLQTYAEFREWQHQFVESESGAQARCYWMQEIGAQVPPLELAADHLRPAIQDYCGRAQKFEVGERLTSAMLELARKCETSLFGALLAAFLLLLQQYSGQEDLVVGVPVSGRTSSSWRQSIGYFINQVLVRTQINGTERVAGFLKRIHGRMQAALLHQQFPLVLLADALNPSRNAGHAPLFQAMFSFLGDAKNGLGPFVLGHAGHTRPFDNLVMESVAIESKTTQLDFGLSMCMAQNRLIGTFQYSTALFEATTVSQMKNSFLCLLEAMGTGSDLSIEEVVGIAGFLDPARKLNLDVSLNGTVSAACIHDLVSRMAARLPDATAIADAEQSLTYAQLEQCTDRLARVLQQSNVGIGSRVGICMHRSVSLIAGILSILKAGAAYVPIDPVQPDERIAFMLRDSGNPLVVCEGSLGDRLERLGSRILPLNSTALAETPPSSLGTVPIDPDNLAYVMYTSGSTGRPKGVMVSHANVVNCFEGMNAVVPCGHGDTLLAATSMSFDISVLELLWGLTRGVKIVVARDLYYLQRSPRRSSEKKIDYSLFYFANADTRGSRNKYELLLEGSRYADQRGFAGIWTPERHFHAFGGLYPNPSVTAAAVATVTRHVQVRAGSVVLPLHNVIRVAEEWSVVDNLSNGRAGLAFASGWHADDFALAPAAYADRKQLMFDAISTFLKLWRGETIAVRNGNGGETQVRIYPTPVQKRPPVWITAAGSHETFVNAGNIGANVLTHLLGQEIADVARNIRAYREAWAMGKHEGSGKVTLMLHTFIAANRVLAKSIVREPFIEYLKTSVDLIKNFAQSLNVTDWAKMSDRHLENILEHAFERYFETSALFGTVADCREMLHRLSEIGVNEIACLIDFGVEPKAALASLDYLEELQPPAHASPPRKSITQLIAESRATLLQCTPSAMEMLLSSPDASTSLSSLRVVMLGGEPLPQALAKQIRQTLSCSLFNMYGPTETTIWSSAAEVDATAAISLGSPLLNTTFRVLDNIHGQPVPLGVPGELHIGGVGVTQGYLNQPALTAEKFVPDAFSPVPGARLYRTGDRVHYDRDGCLRFLGRLDNQVKIRGTRIEPKEVEHALSQHPQLQRVVVIAREDDSGSKYLVAYMVSRNGTVSANELRSFLKDKLTESMVPDRYVFLERLPLTPNGKVDLKVLPAPESSRPDVGCAYVPPQGSDETMIAAVWARVLKLERIGVDDNFFDLGGNSFRLVEVHTALMKELEMEFPLVKMLENSTIRTLAAQIATFKEKHPGKPSLSGAGLKERVAAQRENLRKRNDASRSSLQRTV